MHEGCRILYFLDCKTTSILKLPFCSLRYTGLEKMVYKKHKANCSTVNIYTHSWSSHSKSEFSFFIYIHTKDSCHLIHSKHWTCCCFYAYALQWTLSQSGISWNLCLTQIHHDVPSAVMLSWSAFGTLYYCLTPTKTARYWVAELLRVYCTTVIAVQLSSRCLFTVIMHLVPDGNNP